MRAYRNSPKIKCSLRCYLLAVILLSPTWVGCRSHVQNQRETALLRAEILDLEDQYYALKARCEGAERQLGILPGNNSSTRSYDVMGGKIFDEYQPKFNGIQTDASGEIIIDGPIIYETPQTNRYMRDESTMAGPQAYQQRRPRMLFGRLFGGGRFGMGGRFDNQDYNSVALNAPGEIMIGQNTTFENDPLSLSISHGNPSDVQNPANQEVAEISINPESTRGENTDGKPGDEGIVVFVQPRSKQGEVILSPGELTLSLIDPGSEGEQQRVGLWKFTPEEVRLFEADQEGGEAGYMLHLPWDRNIPKSDRLKLFVRYRTGSGRKLVTAGSLTIQLPEQDHATGDSLADGWTKRAPKWNSAQDHPNSGMVNSSNDSPEILKDPVGSNKHRVPAIPASTTIKRPLWRPTR